MNNSKEINAKVKALIRLHYPNFVHTHSYRERIQLTEEMRNYVIREQYAERRSSKKKKQPCIMYGFNTTK